MKASGTTEEQIERLFPKSIRDRRKEQIQSLEELKTEVVELKKRLQILEEYLQLPNRTDVKNSISG